MGGFLGGMIAGAVVIMLLGAALSLTTPLSRKPVVADVAPEPAPSEVPEVEADKPEAIADADLVTLPAAEPESTDQQPDTLAGLSEIEEAPDDQPQVNESAPVVEEAAVVEPDEVAVTSEAPVQPQAPAVLPDTPIAEGQPELIEEPPAPPAPEVDALEVPVEQPQPESVEPEPDQSQAAELEPAPDFEPESTEAEPLPEIAALEPKEDLPEENPIAVEGDETDLNRSLPRIAAVPQIGGDQNGAGGLTVGRRVVPLTERDNALADQDGSGQTAVLGKPIEAYAAKFDNPDAKPLMSIILIDDEGAYGAEALQDFPYPISFAVSPSDPDAAEKMARHRSAGFEVLAMADLPKTASAQDAEVSMAVWLQTLPETVGILEGVETGIQGNRKLADQVAAIAAGTGRGLITQDNGLNTVQKLAARNGTPSSVIFRDIDGARQDPKIMRRFLDQAAFRAGQEGTVVMLGRLRPDTISALLVWALEDRGGRVAMAPISAVMKQAVQ
ncbi:hypothetical protein NBRC116589_02850 [Ruegeria sp. HU-ET01832]|uniref:divergent polysaccharide deacetylase family protein n=1 Tax=Ruegeria sp. HU-ET01832 TaxID=3135906 RepID=UPI003109EB7A